MTPIKNNILAKVIDTDVTESGIIVKDWRTKKYHGVVLAIGPETKHLKVGDRIQYDHNLVQDYEHEGKNCVWLKENKGFIAKV